MANRHEQEIRLNTGHLIGWRYTMNMNNPNLASLSEAELQAQAWHDLPVDLLCN